MPESKLAAAMAALSVVAAQAPAAEILGIPAGGLLAAYAGALFSLAHTPPERWGKLLTIPAGPALKRYAWVVLRGGGLIFTLSGAAFIAGWLAVALMHAAAAKASWASWAAGLPIIPVAGIAGFGLQHLLPGLLAMLQRRVAALNAGSGHDPRT